jgi:hypothetical protein
MEKCFAKMMPYFWRVGLGPEIILWITLNVKFRYLFSKIVIEISAGLTAKLRVLHF